MALGGLRRQPAARPLKGPWYQTAGGVWVIDSEYECDKLVERLMSEPISGFDTETDGANPRKESAYGKAKVVVWSCAYLDESLGKHPITGNTLAQRVFVPNYGKALEQKWLLRFKPWMEDHTKVKVGHNIFSWDRLALRNHGIELQGLRDTLRMSRQWNVSKQDHDLKTWGAGDELKYDMPGEFSELFRRRKKLKSGGFSTAKNGWELVPMSEVVQDPAWLDTLIDYASMDAKVTLELLPLLVARLRKMRWLTADTTMVDYCNTRLHPYMYVLTGMEEAGQDIDKDWCNQQAERAGRDIEQLERKLVEWAGVDMNWASPEQVRHFLYGEDTRAVVKSNPVLVPGHGFPIPPWTRDNELPSTDEDAVQWLVDHVRNKRDKEGLRTFLKWRKATGTKKKYLEKLPLMCDRHGRIHAQVGPDTETTRLSARNPPVHQIPKPEGDDYLVREAFTVPSPTTITIVVKNADGTISRRTRELRWAFLGGDYSQLEMRILAHFLIVLFGDRKLANDLEEADLHSATAKRIWTLDDDWETTRRKLGIQSEDGHWLDDELTLLAGLMGIPHDFVVKLIKKAFPEFRNKGKILNFSINYGKTKWGLANDIRDQHGDPIGVDAAEVILNAYHAAYPAVARFQKWAINYAYKTGSARDILGGYRPIPELRWESKAARRHGERVAGNTPIQASAAKIAMMAQLKCNTMPLPELKELGFYNELLAEMGVIHTMQIHDELLFKCPWENREAAAAEIKRVMENALDKPLEVPLPVAMGIGTSWREVK